MCSVSAAEGGRGPVGMAFLLCASACLQARGFSVAYSHPTQEQPQGPG